MLDAPYVTGYLSEHFADEAFTTLEGYQRAGGYEAARRAIHEMAPADIIELVKDASHSQCQWGCF